MEENRSSKIWILIFALLLAMGGFFIPFWPLEILAILTLGVGGMPLIAVALGLLLDLIYGPPPGTFHYLYFPFTLAAFFAMGARYFASQYMIERTRL